MPRFRTPCSSTYRVVRELMERLEGSPLTFTQIEQRTGIAHYTILKWRQGKACPNLDTLSDLLTLLGADLTIVRRYRRERAIG